MSKIEFNCLPTMIGSMPHRDAAAACALVSRYLRDIPAWPQLPGRSSLENMYVQYSQGFPGAVVRDGSVIVEHSADLKDSLERLYAAYLGGDSEAYAITPDYAAGLHHCLSASARTPFAVKGQVTGPITWGLMVTDENKRPILYDEVLGDAAAKFLRLKAAWQENRLSKLSRNTIIFLDEPYMTAYGSSSTTTLSAGDVVRYLDEVFGGIKGLKGVHCCGNTDWPVLLSTSTDILSFDTYGYADSLALYPREVRQFLDRGGIIAWGIVPNNAGTLEKESAASLADRLGEAMAPFTRDGFSTRRLIAQGILTPSCGLASLSEEAAARALELLAELSTRVRKRL